MEYEIKGLAISSLRKRAKNPLLFKGDVPPVRRTPSLPRGAPHPRGGLTSQTALSPIFPSETQVNRNLEDLWTGFLQTACTVDKSSVCTPGKNDKPRKRDKVKFNLRFTGALWIIMNRYYLHAGGGALWTMKIGFIINPWLVFQDHGLKAKT